MPFSLTLIKCAIKVSNRYASLTPFFFAEPKNPKSLPSNLLVVTNNVFAAKICSVIAMARRAEVERETAETKVKVTIDLDGAGKVQVDTSIGFFDHMLKTFLRHAWFDATVWARGDVHIDDHHVVEDTGTVLGQAIDKALGERKGVQRFGSAIVPMDEALVLCSIDLSGRSNAFVELPKEGKVGNFDVELAAEFFRAMAINARMTLHLKVLSGENKHHILEAAFKACAVALRQAIAIATHIAEQIPSTKETLT